jgi:hypothetical protein
MVDMDLVVAVSFVLLLTLIIGGIILMFPLTRKLGLLIESRIGDKHGAAGHDGEDLERISRRLAELEDQLRAVSARQEFLDDLLVERRPTDALPRGGTGAQ